jgi:hypothetical protein
VDINIDQKVIADAVASVVQKGLADGVGSWEVQHTINDVVKESVTAADIPSLLRDELQERLTAEAEPIVKEVVDSIIPNLRAAFKASIQTALVPMMYGLLNGKPSYMGEEDKKKWKEAEALLRRAGKEEA